MSPNASHRVRPGLSSAASLMTTLLISFDQEVLNQQLNLVTPEYPFFESPCLPAPWTTTPPLGGLGHRDKGQDEMVGVKIREVDPLLARGNGTPRNALDQSE